MNTVDIVLGIFLLLFVINGIYKGFIKNVMHLAGLIVSILLIVKLGPMAKEFVLSKIVVNEVLAVIIAYILIFLIVMIVAKIVSKILNSIVELLSLKWLNSLLGGVFGLFNGLLILTILFVAINISPFSEELNNYSKQSMVLTNVKKIAEKAGAEFPAIDELTDPLKEKVQDKLVDPAKDKMEKELQEIAKDKIKDKT